MQPAPPLPWKCGRSAGYLRCLDKGVGTRNMQSQPEIRYVTSRDGTRLAMSVQGGGTPVAMVQLHLNDKLDAPGIASRHFWRALSHHRVGRYDARGCGLSDRRGDRISLQTCLDDLEAVMDALGGSPAALFGVSHGTPLAILFAALHPERVSRLLIYGGYARGRLQRGLGVAHVKEAQVLYDVVQVAFGEDVPYRSAFRRTLNSRFYPGASDQTLNEIDANTVGRFDAEVVAAYTSMLQDADVSDAAGRVRCPALVFHARRDQMVPFDEGRQLAALIPDVRFVPLDEENNLPLETDSHWPLVIKEICDFLAPSEQPPRTADALTLSERTLTPRQVEVLRLVSQGRTDKEIARLLGLSSRTIEMHASRALHALRCRTRAEAVHVAVQRGLLR